MHARQLLATGLMVSAVALAFRVPDSPDAAPPATGAVAADDSLAFEANQGQTDDHVRFVSRGAGYTLFLTPAEAVLRLNPALATRAEDRDAGAAGAGSLVRLSLAGANPDPAMTGENLLPRATHYLVGNDPAQWRRNVPSYGKVRYEEVYPGIDAVYYGNGGQLEYDFVVAAGADPDAIAIDFDGVDSLRLDGAGNLLLALDDGELVQQKPVVYQEAGGVRRMVEATYELLGDATVGFAIGAFDASLPLVIDPVLSYSTYLGGNGSDQAHALAVDQAGNTWVTGITDSVEFPWAMAIDSEYGGGDSDAYVCRFTAAGGSPLCAYIGGEGWDEGMAVAIGPDGAAHVAGYTESFDFPVLNPQQPSPQLTPRPEGGYYGDAFVLKINEQADGLAFSTFYGGNDSDVVRAMTVDEDGSIYITGNTWSWENFPTSTGAFQEQAQNPAGQDAFVAKYGSDGLITYSTLLGGSLEDAARGITMGRNGRAYVSGYTNSEDFPTRNALDPSHSGMGDAFIAVLNGAGSGLVYGTYLGGQGEDWGYEVRLDAAGYIHLAGFTFSGDFPQVDGLQQYAGDRDGFIAKVAPDGSSLVFASYIGGSAMDDIRHLQLDAAGNMYLAGYTQSTDFPLVDPILPLNGQDSVVMKIAADGSDMLFSTALGGSDYEVLTGLGLDRDGTLHVAGWTASVDYPLSGAFQDMHVNPPTEETSGQDTFLSRISDSALDSWRGDFNGDGTDDVLWRNVATGQGAIWYSADKRQAVNISSVRNLDWRIVGVGDFDGDGEDDILWRDAVRGGNVIWRSGDSRTSQSVTGVRNTDWTVQGVGDFDGDGTDDILWHEHTNGQSAVWYGASYAARDNLTRINNLAWDIVGTGDFDGDGKADILWRNTSVGQNTIWLSGNSRSTLPVSRIAGLDWQMVGIGDFQGDGTDDILWRNVETGRNAIWKGGSRANQQAVARVASQHWQVHGTGDYNGDGKADILWRDALRGSNSIWRSANSGSKQGVTAVRTMDWVIKS